MIENPSIHDSLYEQIACSICEKKPGISNEECFSSNHKTFCQMEGECRIFKKTIAQMEYICSPLDLNIFLNACPGSGKTEVVGLKAAYETNRWTNEHSGIAFLTFTNNATQVIRDRVVQIVGVGGVNYPHYIGTIDSWMHRYIAHPFAHLITKYKGKKCDMSIKLVENSSSAGFLNSFQTQHSINQRGNIKANQYYYDLSTGKVKFWCGDSKVDTTRNGWVLNNGQIDELRKAKDKFLANGFSTYQDIEYICYKVLELLKISRLIASRFPFIIIDECQDLSVNQLAIIKQLLDLGVYIDFVGDLEQSIYAFKDVFPEEIKKFTLTNNYSASELSDNFRSPQPIVDLCCKIISKANVTGHGGENCCNPNCFFLTYKDEADMVNLTERFHKILSERKEIKIVRSAMIARNYSVIGKIRSHGQTNKSNFSYFPALAINSWKNSHKSIDQLDEAITLIGKYLATKLFPLDSSDSRRYYCPDSVSSKIQWRIFISRVLGACSEKETLVNFENTWKEWSGNFRALISDILNKCKKEFNTISLPQDILKVIQYRCPSGKSNEKVSDSFESVPNKNRYNIRITTIHKIKGETLDAAMLVSSNTPQGGSGTHYWKNWLNDPTKEAARLAYVASSRPRCLLIWALPASNLNAKEKDRLEKLGFTELVDEY